MIALGDLAKHIGAQLVGDAEFTVTGINTVENASAQEVAFIARPEFLVQLPGSQAGALMLSPEHAAEADFNGHRLLVDNPYLAYAMASRLFDNHFNQHRSEIHASANIGLGAQIADDVQVGPNVVIGADAVIAKGCRLGAGSFVGAGSRLGANTLLHANVTIYHGVTLGQNCIVHSGTVIGSDGFGFAPSAKGWTKIHQLGGVMIGDDVEIGANTAIDRGALGDTVIADGVIIDNLVHIAHNVRIGKNTAIAGCCGFAGSTTIGANCTFAGQVGVTGHIEIVDNCHFLGKAMVTSSVTEAGTYSSGMPLQPVKKWRKNAVRLMQLDELARTVSRLVKKDSE